MNHQKTIKWFTIMMLLVGLNNCSDAPHSPPIRALTPEQKQELNELTSKLLISINQTDFFKTNRNEPSKPLRHPAVSDFISRLSEDGNAATVQQILDHPVFVESNDQHYSIARSKDGDVEISQEAQDVLTNLNNEINGYLDKVFNGADTINFVAAR